MKLNLPTTSFAVGAARCLATRAAIRSLAHWSPIDSPEPGYSIILACNAPLAPMVRLQMKLLEKQDRTDLREVIVVFDRPANRLRERIEDEVREHHPTIPTRFVYYTEQQQARLASIGWSKCYSWLSWCLGLAEVRTQHALLHDFDAFPVARTFFADRYLMMQRLGVEYLGIQPYTVNGYRSDEGFAATWEMMFDAAFFRREFRPIDVFPRPRRVHGRWLALDTFHDAQHRAGARRIEPPRPGATDAVVHATQMICQVTHLTQSKRYVAPPNATLLLAPYLLWASGDPSAMVAVRRAAEMGRRDLRLFGRLVDARATTIDRVHGLRTMARMIEHALVGHVRPEVEAYFNALLPLAAMAARQLRSAA